MIKCIFSDVSERDMDLLFLEEFASSKEFLQIFLTKINLENADVCSVEQSKTDIEFGESDMTVIVEKAGKKYGLLIEDKIDAVAMQNQSGRYIERGELGKKNGDYQEYFVFIVAPQSYLQQNDEAKKYPYKVTYEECLKYFQSKQDARSNYKVQQIEQAIHKQKQGYQVVEHPLVTDFWNKYITFSEEKYPQIELISKRGVRGFNARWPQFATILKKVTIFHKSEVGYVDLEIPGAADKIPQLENCLSKCIGNYIAQGIIVVPTGKSASIRMKVPKMDFAKPFENYKNEIEECFVAIEKLCGVANQIACMNNSTTCILD